MFNEIVNFLVRHYSTQRKLDALIIRAFHDNPQLRARINLEGSIQEDASYLVDLLRQDGEIRPGVQALWQLLLTAKNDFAVESSVQTELDGFKAYANKKYPKVDRKSVKSTSTIARKSVYWKPFGLAALIGIVAIGLFIGLQSLDQMPFANYQLPTPISFPVTQTATLIITPAPTSTSQNILAAVQATPSASPAQINSPILSRVPETQEAKTPTPLPQNGLIAFSKNGDIYTINENEMISIVERGNNYDPTWSPDGKRIAFESDRENEQYQIYVIDMDGSSEIRLTSEGGNANPAWSPDGKRIAFVSDRDGGANQIYVMDADGSNATRLTSAGNNYGHVWSPDGKQIAFISNRERGAYQIYVMDADGSNAIQLTSERNNYDPKWSPDGQQIVFVSIENSRGQIYVVDSAGSETTLMTLEGKNYDPVWSPDGKRIAYQSIRSGGEDIGVIGLEDGSITYLSTQEKDDIPMWSPDGQQIAFLSGKENMWYISVMTHDGEIIAQWVTEGDNSIASWQPIPWYITLTPNP